MVKTGQTSFSIAVTSPRYSTISFGEETMLGGYSWLGIQELLLAMLREPSIGNQNLS